MPQQQVPSLETITAVAPPGWRRIVRVLEVRLRFLLALGILALLMAGWPWLRGGWDSLTNGWHGHRAQSAVSGDSEFFCPMDPGILSAWPAICPICNMDLIARKKTDAVLLPEGVLARMQFSPYRVQLTGIRTVVVERSKNPDDQADSGNQILIPIESVVEHGEHKIVYVESMPGIYDAVAVQLGHADGNTYPVLEGLKPGQRVVAAGAFLIDAESRLNPGAATQYFGANAQTAANRPPAPPQKRAALRGPAKSLSAEDQRLVDQQRICPVTEAPLGSMGLPVSTVIDGRKVFLCCRGCESSLKAEPDKFLARLTAAASEESR